MGKERSNRKPCTDATPKSKDLQRLPQLPGDLAPSLLESDPELRKFLEQLVRLLLGLGIDFVTLRDHLQLAYVIAASQISSFRSKRPNQSGIAAMTGLTRTEIRRLLDGNAKDATSSQTTIQGVDRVIHGWINDPEFTGDCHLPLTLSRGKGPGTFDTLVSRYGADVPTAAVLKELVRRRRVNVATDQVTMRRTGNRLIASPAVQRFMSLANPILEAVSSGKDHKVALETRSVTIEVPDELSHSLLKAHLTSAVEIFFDQARIAANGVIRSQKRSSRPAKGATVRLDLISLTKK